MTAQLTFDGKPADFEAFVASIVSATIKQLRATETEATESGKFSDKRIYNLTNPLVHARLGLAAHKNATTILVRRLRSAGIHFTVGHRTGSTATGAELNRYFEAYQREQKSYLSKN